MRCEKGGDVQAFLTSLQYKREELAATGVSITDSDYQHMVLKGITKDIARFTFSILTSAHILGPTSIIDTDTLIDYICEEADWLKNRCTRSHKDTKAKQKAGSDQALTVTGSEGKKR